MGSGPPSVPLNFSLGLPEKGQLPGITGLVILELAKFCLPSCWVQLPIQERIEKERKQNKTEQKTKKVRERHRRVEKRRAKWHLVGVQYFFEQRI